jgi:hypothetical protein
VRRRKPWHRRSNIRGEAAGEANIRGEAGEGTMNPTVRPFVELVRLEEDVAAGTFGVLRINGAVQCWTLEPPDRENETGRSSIPAQQYTAVRHKSPKFGKTFLVKDVPGRTLVLFHTGNRNEETKGCILLGKALGVIDGDRAIIYSKAAFKAFMDVMKAFDEFKLSVVEAY